MPFEMKRSWPPYKSQKIIPTVLLFARAFIRTGENSVDRDKNKYLEVFYRRQLLSLYKAPVPATSSQERVFWGRKRRWASIFNSSCAKFSPAMLIQRSTINIISLRNHSLIVRFFTRRRRWDMCLMPAWFK